MLDDDRASAEQLLHRAVLAGDANAWQRLYEESFDPLYRYALWRSGGSREQADEVVQETWLIAVRQISRFDPSRGSFVSWTRGIAANVMRNQLRRLASRRQHAESIAGDPHSNGHAARAMQQLRQAEQVAQSLAELPQHYEQVLRAKYVDGYSVAEIAQQRGETPKAVESLLVRARENFRQEYKNQ